MPCYTEWDAYLDKESDEYRTKKAELDAKLKTIRHIVDYYYGVHRLPVPQARHTERQAFMELADGEVAAVGMTSGTEAPVLQQIQHHLACDGVGFTELYDLTSLLNLQDPIEAGYARVIMICANKLRAG